MRIEVVDTADVVVAGGGPSGICAALAAARLGSNVLLVERDASLGGEATHFLPFGTFHTASDRQIVEGIPEELVEALVARGGSQGHLTMEGGWGAKIVPLDPEVFKSVVQDKLREAGARILLNSLVVGVLSESSGLCGVIVANKGGLQVCLASVVVDATGDGDVASFAGARCEKGESGDGAMQPGTLMFRLRGVNEEGLSRSFPPLAPVYGPKLDTGREGRLHYAGDFQNWSEELQADGSPFPPELKFWATSIREEELLVNAARVQNVDPTNPASVTEAELAGRELVRTICDFLRRHVEGFEGSYLQETASHVGIREGRRIVGLYVLTEDDVLSGRKFHDGVARGAYGVDIHDESTLGGWSFQHITGGEGFYEIPYRCMIPVGIDNLLAAGRCISTTRGALGSTRIMSTCMALGEAAGSAASLALGEGVKVRDIDPLLVRRHLGLLS